VDDEGDDEGLGTMAASFGLIAVSVPFAGWLAVLAGGELVDGLGVFSEPGLGVVEVVGGGVVLGLVDVGGVVAGGDDTGGGVEVGGVTGGVSTGGAELWVPVRDGPTDLHPEAAGAGAAE
jgi:hypothetical protein